MVIRGERKPKKGCHADCHGNEMKEGTVEMKEILSLELDGLPPTVNNMYRNVGHRRYKTAKCQEYQERVTEILRKKWKYRAALKGSIELRITFKTKEERRWDIDNRVKALQDCLSEGGVIEDDRQINILHVERHRSDKTVTLIEVIENDKAERLSGGNPTLGDKARSGRLACKTDRRTSRSAKALREGTM